MTEQRFLGRQEIAADVRRIQSMLGTVYAGGGTVKLYSGGIEIILTNAEEAWRAYNFVDDAGTVISKLTGVLGATANTVMLIGNPIAGRTSLVDVRGKAGVGDVAQAEIVAERDAGTYCGVWCFVDAAENRFVNVAVDGDTKLQVTDAKIYAKLRASATEAEDVRLQADNELTWFSSVRALKRDITPWQAPTAAFMQLRPVTFRPVEDPEHAPIVGLIAEDVEAAMPYAVSYRDGQLSSWDDKQLLITLVSVAQEQQRDVAALRAEVAALQAEVAAILGAAGGVTYG